MDGAVLYDTTNKRYLQKIELTQEDKIKVQNLLDEMKLVYFANVVIDDTLLIYHQKPDNEIQQRLIEELRTSPYRNYINRPLPPQETVVYFMMIYPTLKAQQIFSTLVDADLLQKLKILFYPSNDYP